MFFIVSFKATDETRSKDFSESDDNGANAEGTPSLGDGGMALFGGVTVSVYGCEEPLQHAPPALSQQAAMVMAIRITSQFIVQSERNMMDGGKELIKMCSMRICETTFTRNSADMSSLILYGRCFVCYVTDGVSYFPWRILLSLCRCESCNILTCRRSLAFPWVKITFVTTSSLRSARKEVCRICSTTTRWTSIGNSKIHSSKIWRTYALPKCTL